MSHPRTSHPRMSHPWVLMRRCSPNSGQHVCQRGKTQWPCVQRKPLQQGRAWYSTPRVARCSKWRTPRMFACVSEPETTHSRNGRPYHAQLEACSPVQVATTCGCHRGSMWQQQHKGLPCLQQATTRHLQGRTLSPDSLSQCRCNQLTETASRWRHCRAERAPHAHQPSLQLPRSLS